MVVKEVGIGEALKVDASIIEFGQPRQKSYFEERYRDKREKLILVAYIQDQPAGYMIGYADEKHSDAFYCWMTGVSPEFRRRGILKALMNYLRQWAWKRGYSKITVKTRNSRREMLAYLVKYGFLFTGVVQRDDIDNNTIFLEKALK